MSDIYVSNVYSCTDVGKVRNHNEDFLAYYEPSNSEQRALYGSLYIVADGMGGGAAGEVASRYAVQKALYTYYHTEPQEPGKKLRAAFAAANTDIFKYTTEHLEIGRMGTTLVAAVVRKDTLTIANTGDSRAYLLRGEEIRQVTEDHSLVARLVAEGHITPREAQQHPKKNVILYSIGGDADVIVDIFDGTVLAGDRVLLCTDGLTRYVTDEEIQRVLTELKPTEATRRLVDMANSRGGKDNISVLLLTLGFEQHPRASGNLPEAPVIPNWQDISDIQPSTRDRQSQRAWHHFLGDILWALQHKLRRLFCYRRSKSDVWAPTDAEPSFIIPVGETQENQSLAEDIIGGELSKASTTKKNEV
jgi:PPM family protein phosphatase